MCMVFISCFVVLRWVLLCCVVSVVLTCVVLCCVPLCCAALCCNPLCGVALRCVAIRCVVSVLLRCIALCCDLLWSDPLLRCSKQVDKLGFISLNLPSPLPKKSAESGEIPLSGRFVIFPYQAYYCHKFDSEMPKGGESPHLPSLQHLFVHI